MDPSETQEPENPTEEGEEIAETPEADQQEGRPLSQINILPLVLRKAHEWIDRRAKEAVSNCKKDEDGRKEFMDRRANQLRLLTGTIPTLGAPAQGAKAPHIAIMCKAILHLWARIFDQVIPAKGDIVHCAPFGPDDEQKAIERERHLNWQMRHRMPDYSSGHQKNIFSWISSGSSFRHYRWDPVENTHRLDHCPIDDIVLPYTDPDDHPLMKTVPRITRILRLARWEAEIYEEQGFWSNLDEIFPPEDGGSTSSTDVQATIPRSDEESEVQRAASEIQGVERPERVEKDGKQEWLEVHTRLKFPSGLGVVGLDGMTKPVVLTVHRRTKKPVALTIREEPDPIDQARFDAEMQAYQIALNNIAKQASTPAMPGAVAPVPPVAPKPPRPVRQQTVYNIIHYRLFPNPEGIYGWGVGYLLEGSNELANALAAEYMLGAKFENLKGGWMAKGTRAKRGDVPFEHGKFIETELEPEVLDKAIKLMEFNPPSEGLMRVVDKLESNAEIAADADVLSGEKGASNETAKSMQIRNANAMTLISVMTRLYLEPMKYEVQMIAHGNAVQMTGPETFPHSEFAGPDKQSVSQVTVGPEHYQREPMIEFTADARMASKPERVADALGMFDRVVNSPLAQSPMGPRLLDYTFRKVCRAAELPDVEAAMGPPPPPPQQVPPPSPMSQDNENAGFFNEADHPVMPDDNHMEHLHKINELKQSPMHQHLSSTGKQLLDRHERAHVSQLYLQLQELQKATGIDVHGAARGMGGVPGGADGGEIPQGDRAPTPRGPSAPPPTGEVGTH